jgi:hypothetical protein
MFKTTALAALLLSFPVLAEAPPPEGYDSRGRRDPFRPAGSAEASRSCPVDAGLQGLQADHVRLRGMVLTSRGPLVALESPAGQGTLPARLGDRLCDGVVHEIDYKARTVVIRIEREHALRPWRDRTLSLS